MPCHYSKGNAICPAKGLTFAFVGKKERLILKWEKALQKAADNPLKRLTLMSQLSSELMDTLPEEDIKEVMARLGF